jgi:hypothetical protein
LTCFISDPVGLQLRDAIGIDNIAWECDYPHSDSSWPNSAEDLLKHAQGVSDSDLQKITLENACRWFSFDPFALRTKEQSTVGALRKEAAGHSVEVRSFDTGRIVKGAPGADLAALAESATA